MKERSHDDAMAEMFKEDPAFAIEYLAHLVKYGEKWPGKFEQGHKWKIC